MRVRDFAFDDRVFAFNRENAVRYSENRRYLCFGTFTVYILIGLGILQALHLFNTPHFMAKVGAALLIALGGISLISELFPSFPIKLRIPQSAHHKMAELMNKASLPTAFFWARWWACANFPAPAGRI